MEESKVFFAISHMKRTALEWFKHGIMEYNTTIAPTWCRNWQDFIMELHTNFGPANPMGTVEAELHHLTMNHDTHLMEYLVCCRQELHSLLKLPVFVVFTMQILKDSIRGCYYEIYGIFGVLIVFIHALEREIWKVLGFCLPIFNSAISPSHRRITTREINR